MKDFKEKTAEEVAEMELQDQIKYFNDLNQYRAEKMTALKEEMEQAATDEISKQIEALKAEINEANVKQLGTLQKAMEDQGVALRKLMSEGAKTEKTLYDILEEKSEDLKKIIGNRNESVKFTIDKATVLTSSVSDSTVAYRDPNIGRIQRASNVLRPLFQTGVVSPGQGGTVRYIDENTNTNAAAMQTEGSAKAEGTLNWVEKSMSLQTVAEWIKASKQALTDFAFIETEIRTKLMRDLASKVEDEIWDGNGTAPNLKGVYTYADTYSAVASGITDANIFDLMVAIKGDIMDSSNYMPNVVVANPSNIRKYAKAKKDSTHNYVLPYFVEYVNGQFFVDGMLVIESSQVADDTLLVGDFNFATLYTLGAVDVSIGYDADDFTKNLVTILAEERLGLLVRSVDTGAFEKSTDISADLVTLGS